MLTGKKMMVQERQNSRSKALQEGRGGIQCPQGAAVAGGVADLGSRPTWGQEEGDVLFQVLTFSQ